jgi:hypothetical protein
MDIVYPNLGVSVTLGFWMGSNGVREPGNRYTNQG